MRGHRWPKSTVEGGRSRTGKEGGRLQQGLPKSYKQGGGKEDTVAGRR